MKIENLKMFCLVVEEGSISQAARLSFVTQPAATRQIHQLEDFYGTLLFERVEGRLKITEAGELLYPFAKAILSDFYQSKEVIGRSISEYNASLRVGASLTIGEYLLPSLLGAFKKQEPDIKVMLTIKNTTHILEELSNDVIDLALVEGLFDNKAFKVKKFAEDELILVVPPGHLWENRRDIPIEELEKERMIWRESSSGTRLIVENTLREHGVLSKIESYMELGSTQAIKGAVEAGLGVSILPRLTLIRELEQGYLKEVALSGISIIRNLWMVSKERRYDKQAVTKFEEFIQG
ncbi:LysR family transcriptional regulator [Bacillus massiliglaciei]|uniref:LysR family transcriptional regulator n=1 Tax=Bacillus massiliglaciei TaxID=1816693 RepID=UPI000AF08B53|nr:LysR family transcriptional regulator [Bacillus massiliglaciei]